MSLTMKSEVVKSDFQNLKVEMTISMTVEEWLRLSQFGLIADNFVARDFGRQISSHIAKMAAAFSTFTNTDSMNNE